MPRPELSVLIASHDRPEKLRRCLESLASQNADPAGFEVVVADDGSPESTATMVESFEAPYALRLLRLPKGGKSAALNAAIEAAAAPVCLFLDDDILAAPGLVAAHSAAHRENPLTLGIGRLEQRPPADGDWLGVAHATAWNERYDELAKREADWPDTYGGNFSAPREKLRQVGGFDTGIEAIEDIELGYRLSEAGCESRYLPEAGGVHDDEKPRAKLVAEIERYGAFCAEFAERVPVGRRKLLGWFLEPTPRDVVLRRLFLLLRTPPSLLASLGGAIPGAGRRQVWFGFVSRYAFWRGVRSGMGRRQWLQTTRGVPVLAYHAFGEDEEGDRFAISRRAFARHLRLLRLLRYRVIGFAELAKALQADEELPRRTAVITIDDGYVDNLTIARPLLRRQRIPATVFLVSGRLGGVNDWTEEGAVAGRRLLTQAEATELAGEGIEIGAHTRTHPALTAIAGEQLSEELAGSREDLEALLGSPVRTFAYPYGFFSPAAVAAVREAGYEGACTVENRLARPGDDPLEIPRVEIKGTDSVLTFLRKLWLGGA
ncbi:MAG TPA: polysaccharide deacetylase family protein [Solirubrobacterales bacterium]|nr:polysaccharide deacetylase family protein [Solirubrobacterales bacterium]